mmetsp:Transcript_88300/g.201913  ORF Transcript_88300/g.201913 Transcript_88300/m.201913 type:complete len:431 (+) Transcript_88300:29-1321(+)
MRVVALVFAAGSADTCHDQTGCGECVNRTVVGVHACYWCEIDQGCHAVGSAVSPCTPGGADDACISLASASKCGHKSADACDAAGSDASKPRQIHLSLGGSGGMRVTWKTRAKVSTVSVMYAEDMSTAVGELATIERSVEYLKSQGGHGYHHVALMSNLRQDTTYQYRIVCDGVTSRVRQFRTESSDHEAASFLVVGDMGYGAAGEAVASRSRIEILKDRTNLTLHVGDISYADDSFLHLHTSCPEEFCYEAVYDNYMEWIENVSDTKPYMVAAGNHESECHSPACLVSSEIKESLRNFSAYNARWAMPSLESGGVANMWYSFNFGPVHFVVVNTETDFPDAPEADYGDGGKIIGLKAGHFAPNGAYRAWLNTDLQEASENRAQRPWIVAFGHRPWVFQNGTSRDHAVEAAHSDLFQKYGVDLYLAGHVV